MNRTLLYGTFCSMFVVSFFVYGQTYNKCHDAQGNTSFTDRPCPAGSYNEMTIEAAFPPSGNQSHSSEASSSQRSLDMKVSEAIGSGDLRRAKELALTPEHWEKIRVAERGVPKTEADAQAEMRDSIECKQATRSYDVEARFADDFSKKLVDAKKHSMYLACGIKEPTSININNTVNFR